MLIKAIIDDTNLQRRCCYDLHSPYMSLPLYRSRLYRLERCESHEMFTVFLLSKLCILIELVKAEGGHQLEYCKTSADFAVHSLSMVECYITL